jgi:hypothetical protein
MHWGHSIARDTVKKILVCCTMARATDFVRSLSDRQGQSPQSMPLQLPPAGCCWPTNRWRSLATSRPPRPSAPTGPAKTRQQQCTHPTQKDNDSAREGHREEPANKQTPMQRAVEASANRCAWLAIRPSRRFPSIAPIPTMARGMAVSPRVIPEVWMKKAAIALYVGGAFA